MTNILIIEDDDTTRSNLADRLTLEGFRIRMAASGEAGLLLAKEEPPNLVLCDINMPGLDGYGVLHAWRAQAQTAAVPFIFLTCKSGRSQMRAGMNMGADDYLTKPVTKGHLLAAIRTRLWKHDLNQARLDEAIVDAGQDAVLRLSDELLTPLKGLLSASKLLAMTDPNRPVAEDRERVQEIREVAEGLQHRVRRFLLCSELRTASQSPTAQAQLQEASYIPAWAWVPMHAQFIARRAERAGDLHLDVREVEVSMAPMHFNELVLQLVDNAFKFSHPGSVVRIQLIQPPGEQCVLTVRDQGRGLTPDQLRAVEAFRQFDAVLSAQPVSGLGLALVQQIVALYGGTFSLESELGQGTLARVRLPRARLGTQRVNLLDVSRPATCPERPATCPEFP
jgi:signal transduction histidine kinase